MDVDGGMSDFLYNISFSSHNLRKTPHKNPVIGHSWDNIYGTRLEGELASDVTHVLQASYCAPSREESTIHDQFMSHTRENGGTGIKIRPRQTEIPAPSPSGQQGTAARRIRLRLPQSSSPVRDDEASSSLEDCESCSPPSPEVRCIVCDFTAFIVKLRVSIMLNRLQSFTISSATRLN